MTVVVGTAGHIDHGKTALLRALTGIDADRLPEERRRGMTIDVGYAHLDLPDGSSIDFVDVPGHDALVGNMLVGTGEIDAVLLVVAADDGIRAQTIEHLELLDALGFRDGVAVVTKADLVPPTRLAAVRADVAELLGRSQLAGSPVIEASTLTGAGIAEVRSALIGLRDRVEARGAAGPRRLAIDRAFTVRGRGAVVTGSLRGGRLATGAALRLEPGAAEVRVRGLEVHHVAVSEAHPGRVAANVVGVAMDRLVRGTVLTSGPGVAASDRLLVALTPARAFGAHRGGDGGRSAMRDAGRQAGPPAALGSADSSAASEPAGSPAAPGSADSSAAAWPPDQARLRLHIGTAQVGATIGAKGRESARLPDGDHTAILRLDAPVATVVGERAVLRRPSPPDVVAGLVVLDVDPPRGVARHRATAERLAGLAAAVRDGDADAVADASLALHGALTAARLAAIVGAFGRPWPGAGGAGAGDDPDEGRSPRPGPDRPSSSQPGPGPEPGDRPRGYALAPDVRTALEAAAIATIAVADAASPASTGMSVAVLRATLVTTLRRIVAVRRDESELAEATVAAVGDDLVRRRRLRQAGDRIGDPDRMSAPPPGRAAAMDRLVALLDVAAPAGLSAAARTAGCPPDAVRDLEAAGRIVRVEADLAWSAPEFERLAARALAIARQRPLAPATLRDATGTSRRYVMPLLEELGRRGILARTPAGHVPGPHAPRERSAQ